MKKIQNIRNLDTLEKEIYRLKLEARSLEDKFDRNMDHLENEFPSMAMNSIFGKCAGERSHKKNFFDSLFDSSKFSEGMNRIRDEIASRAADGIEGLVEKIFHKKK